MWIKKWDDLPENMKAESVKKYYNILHKKRLSFVSKRIFDLVTASAMLIILFPVIILLMVFICLDSHGPAIFSQSRVTQYGRQFRIFKLRTMVSDTGKSGLELTMKEDLRITRIGRILRKYRLDEIPQLINIISGNMSFVGTRPEVPRYVAHYTEEMMATLLLPAGLTSEASILYKDEEILMEDSQNPEETYINEVLPEKMEYNLRSIESFNFFRDLRTIIRTPLAVTGLEGTTEHINTAEKEDFYV